jgi:glycosyltransferase involved in cell wall biosynthesis
MKVTFVLNGDGRSGGVRVTVLMGNLLLERGIEVRIASPHPKLISREKLANIAGYVLGHRPSTEVQGWFHLFKGEMETFGTLDDLAYEAKEIVIAVGTFTICQVHRLSQSVIKVRFNHGFPYRMTPEFVEAWSLRMPTITVSKTLVPKLEQMTGEKVLAVVPNGISLDEYFVETKFERDGVGVIYSRHPNKAPQDIVMIMQRVHKRWPNIPCYAFGTDARPAALAHCHYFRLPSIAQARELYNRSRVWLLPSYTEGLPGVLLEAMACGCVAISSDNDGGKEIICDRQNGRLVRCGNVGSFVESIAEIWQDSALQTLLVKGAAATVRDYSWSKAADTMEAFLRSISRGDIHSIDGSTMP